MAISGQFLTTIQTSLLPVYYEKRLFDFVRANLQMYNLGQQRAVPRNYGKVVWFNRPVPLTAATGALSESLTPAQTQLSSEGVSGTVKIYGTFTARSELAGMSLVDINWMSDIFNYQAMLTIDTLIRAEFTASASGIQTYGGLSAAGTSALLTGTAIRKAVTRLRKGNVPGLFDANTKYALLAHPAAIYDLMADTTTGGWQDLIKQSPLVQNEDLAVRGFIRDVFGARVFDSTNVLASAQGVNSAASTDANAYYNMIFGRDAYGVIQIQGPGGGNLANPQIIVKDIGSGGTEDPLNQRATIGWKAIFTPLFLATGSDSVRGHVLYTDASVT